MKCDLPTPTLQLKSRRPSCLNESLAITSSFLLAFWNIFFCNSVPPVLVICLPDTRWLERTITRWFSWCMLVTVSRGACITSVTFVVSCPTSSSVIVSHVPTMRRYVCYHLCIFGRFLAPQLGNACDRAFEAKPFAPSSRISIVWCFLNVNACSSAQATFVGFRVTAPSGVKIGKFKAAGCFCQPVYQLCSAKVPCLLMNWTIRRYAW